MSALSDIDNAEKTAKNASPLRKLFKGNEIEASAIEAFTAKKKLEAQRQELKTFINFHYLNFFIYIFTYIYKCIRDKCILLSAG